jgi:peptidoglycan/LPS O-acetylase OafA/YrhL
MVGAMKHDPRLDGLRALAALAVVLFHETVLPGGSVGVDVFFVLSGWLITQLLWREAEGRGDIDLTAFLVRRVRRLVPALALLLVAYAILSPTLWPGYANVRWLDIGSAALYLANWREVAAPTKGPLAHTWSLAIEGQFYLLWPLAIIALVRMSRRLAAFVIAAAWLALTAARAVVQAGGHDALAYFAFPLHATGMLLGAALAVAPPGARRGWGAAGVGVLGILALFPHDHWSFYWQTTVAELAAAAVILQPPKWLAWGPLVFVGLISYGVYLWHIPVWLAFGPAHFRAAQLLTVPVSLALASASYFTVEAAFRRPFLRILASPERVA